MLSLVDSSLAYKSPSNDFISKRSDTAKGLSIYIDPAQPETLNNEIISRFINDTRLLSIPVVKNQIPVGLINRFNFINQFAKPFQRELLGNKPCMVIGIDTPLIVEMNTTIQELSFLIANQENHYFVDGFIVTNEGKYQGVVSGQELLRSITKMQIEEFRISATAFESKTGMVITNADTQILRVNRAFKNISGYDESEVIGKNADFLSSGRHDAKFFTKMWAKIRRTGCWDGEIWEKRKNGEVFPALISINTVKDYKSNVSNYVISISDSTERQKTIEQLRNFASELEQANSQIEKDRASLVDRVAERTAELEFANKAKDSFLATMSHEIRTPLGGMLGMMELLSLSTLDPQTRQQLEAARLSGNSLLRIVNDILDWSKIEAGKLELVPHNTSISEMLKSVINTYAQIASSKGLTLQIVVDPKISSEHTFDPLRLSQIINNFTSNAVKFTQRGSVLICAELLGSHEGYETICFNVKDTGIGLTQTQQNQLFKDYTQATADTTRLYGGTGLGLSICLKLAVLMEGKLKVESTPNVGSTFSFTLGMPVVNPNERRKQNLPIIIQDRRKSEQDAQLIADLQNLNVLIVDDHPINRMLLKQQLNMLGVKVEVAESGLSALEAWRNGDFELVITDCHMPEMDGYELTQNIRAHEQRIGTHPIPIIAWTANVLVEEAGRCHAAGMNDVLTKPTELADLGAMLVKWTSGK